jgi:hypothetical protein
MMSATCSTSSVLAASGAALSCTVLLLLHLRPWGVLPAAVVEQQDHSRTTQAALHRQHVTKQQQVQVAIP